MEKENWHSHSFKKCKAKTIRQLSPAPRRRGGNDGDNKPNGHSSCIGHFNRRLDQKCLNRRECFYAIKYGFMLE